eukprot:TRINITY_DN2475_c0_g2_i1.p2 TRINITY_DN2475_c0_g2~~TRINITY_DN2475_c0_g2_i1.p2  ORF type:complete len:184 (-),score=0.61 TRINITY_DN2475_c0_g2_i1:292-843(-)
MLICSNLRKQKMSIVCKKLCMKLQETMYEIEIVFTVVYSRHGYIQQLKLHRIVGCYYQACEGVKQFGIYLMRATKLFRARKYIIFFHSTGTIKNSFSGIFRHKLYFFIVPEALRIPPLEYFNYFEERSCLFFVIFSLVQELLVTRGTRCKTLDVFWNKFVGKLVIGWLLNVWCMCWQFFQWDN